LGEFEEESISFGVFFLLVALGFLSSPWGAVNYVCVCACTRGCFVGKRKKRRVGIDGCVYDIILELAGDRSFGCGFL